MTNLATRKSKIFLDFGPLIHRRDYRYLYLGQFLSFFGSALTMVALPYQIFELTKSSAYVGALGIVQVIPMIVMSLIGGARADSVDRRKLLLHTEFGFLGIVLLLFINASLASPSLLMIYLCAAMTACLIGFHRPAFESLNQSLLEKEDMVSAGGLSFLKFNLNMIVGSALAGIIIAASGVKSIYLIDAFTFLFSIAAILMIKARPKIEASTQRTGAKIREGIRYARSRQEIMGSYVVDFVAMVFGMPMALFPAISVVYGGPKAAGWLYAGVPLGACLAVSLSGFCKKIIRQGAGIVIAATLWGVAIVGFGVAYYLHLPLGWLVFFLALAGAFDAISAILRSTLWNQTIDHNMRGRMASLEMISFASGPMIGNFEAGTIAHLWGNSVSILSGGLLCVIGVVACIWVYPGFWKFKATSVSAE